MSDSNPLESISKLAEPVNTLITKISDAIGVMYESKRIIKRANAEAEAQKIQTLAEIESDDLRRRALNRFIVDEERKQLNIENVIEKAIPDIKPNAAAEELEEDWLAHFFDKMKFISDKSMQTMWSKILAEETNRPQSYSKRTIEIMSLLDKKDANLFETLGSFSFEFSGITDIYIYESSRDSFYQDYGITFERLHHLDSLGLIRFSSVPGFAKKVSRQKIGTSYFGQKFIIDLINNKNGADYVYNTGEVLLTRSGREIASITEPTSDHRILEHIFEHWMQKKILISSEL